MINNHVADIVNRIPLVDTHEHLNEESEQLKEGDGWQLKDIGMLFFNYLDSELAVAGMPDADLQKLFKQETDPAEKWKLVKPWWKLVKYNGYGRMLRESIKILYGEEDITDNNWKSINEKIKALAKPGYFRKIINEISNIDHCQVNNLEEIEYRDTEMPDLLLQDLGTVGITSGFDPKVVAGAIGHKPAGLDDFIEAIDRVFAEWGPKTIAVKNQAAYGRSLDYDTHTRKDIESLIKKGIENNWDLSIEDRKPIGDYLFLYSLEAAKIHNLPVKLHTGYLAGHNHMHLDWLRRHGGDMARLCREHPDNNFVFMHITYPFQGEAIAVAKHYPNAYIDMCWAWILNPAAAVRFLKDFIMAAPVNKIFTFGGDVRCIEMVPGNAVIARKGITQAVSELLEEGWLRESQVEDILNRVMHKNAYDLFDITRFKKSLLSG